MAGPAEVVKVENPNGRAWLEERCRPGTQPNSHYFKILNANKKSITVDLKTPRGIQLVKDMVKSADVFAENLAPGTIERLGLGDDVLKAINPGIIYCQVKVLAKAAPTRRTLRFRHDRAGRRWHDERHRRTWRRPSSRAVRSATPCTDDAASASRRVVREKRDGRLLVCNSRCRNLGHALHPHLVCRDVQGWQQEGCAADGRR